MVRFFRYSFTILAALCAVAFNLSAQVSWSAEVAPAEDGLQQIVVKASIEEGYHIYDFEEYKNGPSSTSITFELPGSAELVGGIVPSVQSTKEFSDVFGMEIGSWSGNVKFVQKVRGAGDAKVNIEWMACNDSGCIPPDEITIPVTINGEVVAAQTPDETVVAQAPEETEKGGKGLWAMIIEAILWGFAALLTPCVFPMVPMTVSFFLKGSQNKAKGKFRAAMYGLFIVLLYTLPIVAIILITRLVGGDAVTADIFNWLATHWLPNLLFFVIFMVFAASFFGAFEITMPSKLVNGSDKQSEGRSGLGGVFFMALTLVLVSFSCTGPIVGTVLIKSTAGEFWAPMVTMLAFSLAFALPFVLFALFPSLLSNLPKSGGWLNSVKVVLGFVEVALGLKFFSTADQVYHWGILDREIYLAIWIVVFTLLGFYLLGKIKFKYDDDVKHISVLRLFLAIVVFSFVVYMIPGMWGAPLKGLSGYMPPIETQDFVIGRYAPAAQQQAVGTVADGRKYADFLEAPLGMDAYFDLGEASKAAKEQNKPVFVAFTGHGCVNCREMEARVWSDASVQEIMRNNFVLCMLYCDDKAKVADEDVVTTESGKVLNTIGKINSHVALSRFNVNAQPFYVIQNPEGEALTTRGYNLDVEAFKEWLLSVK
ncbi:MAG: thioredoxin family protein [Bacteroidales bacterium]|nr:thioredoxin family protein [Candidatus Equibacterium intestinale]